MAQFSAFAPFGLFDFSEAQSPAEAAYNALVAQRTPLFSMAVGTYPEAKTFAEAIAIGCARATVVRGLNQRIPSKAHDRIPTLERDRGIVSDVNASPDQRRAILAARELLVHGSREEALVTELQAVLGTALLQVRATKASERVVWPSPAGGVGTYPRADAPITFGQILDPIAALLVPVTVRMTVLGGPFPKVGQALCIEPDNNVLAESVVVQAVSFSSPLLTSPDLLTVTATRGKDAGAYFSSAFPILTSTQRELQVIVTPTAARSPSLLRRQVHQVMARHCKSTTRWQIIESADHVTTGPWVVGVARVGATAIGSAPYTF